MTAEPFAAGWMESFAVQNLGDLIAREPLAAEFQHPALQGKIIAKKIVTRQPLIELMLCLCAAAPANRDVNYLRRATAGDNYPLDQLADDSATVGAGCRGRV